MKIKKAKSLLAMIMAVVMTASIVMPGFAAYGEDMGGNGGVIVAENGDGDNGIYADVPAEQTATPSDLPTTEMQTTSPAANKKRHGHLLLRIYAPRF